MEAVNITGITKIKDGLFRGEIRDRHKRLQLLAEAKKLKNSPYYRLYLQRDLTYKQRQELARKRVYLRSADAPQQESSVSGAGFLLDVDNQRVEAQSTIGLLHSGSSITQPTGGGMSSRRSNSVSGRSINHMGRNHNAREPERTVVEMASGGGGSAFRGRGRPPGRAGSRGRPRGQAGGRGRGAMGGGVGRGGGAQGGVSLGSERPLYRESRPTNVPYIRRDGLN